MDPLTTSLGINLLATGIAAGANVTEGKVRDVLRRRQYDDDREHVASVFAEELQDAIKAEHDRRDTNELAGVTDDWEAVVAEVIGSDAEEIGDDNCDRDDVGHLFADEEDAAIHIADAIATVQGFDLAETPQLREELVAAVRNAYREAIVAFEGRIAETDLADVFQQELQLDIREVLGDLQARVGKIGADVSALLTQDARNEGFRQLSPVYFERATPTPETSWRTTFTLADVEAGIPARRDGHDDQYADEELLAALRKGEDRLVVGRAGAGKSTLCKQVAVAWYQHSELGEVLYRDSDAGGGFESTEALREAIDRGDGHVLVVVEDAIRANARAIFDVIEEYDAVADVTFLLDARTEELDSDSDAQTLDQSGERRQLRVAGSIERYYLPAISEADVERTIAAFEGATGRTVDRSAGELYEEIRAEGGEGIGRFLLLSFHLPFGDGAVERGENESGLETHVRSRYRTLMNPGSEEALRDLSRFDADLLADVGVMVNLLNASGIGIYPELVHALGYEYGHDVETHDEIEGIRKALEGWFLFPVDDDSEQVRTTHDLWSTLYLRAVARDYLEQRANSRRRERSEPRAARCMDSLFALFDDEAHREALSQEFPESSMLKIVERNLEAKADEYVKLVFGLTRRWSTLAPLAGTETTARYDLPTACSDKTCQLVMYLRGHAQLDYGTYLKARGEYERLLEDAQSTRDRQLKANSLGNLGIVAEMRGEYEKARKYIQQALELERELGDVKGESKSLSNLGIIAGNLGAFDQAKEYHQRSLDLARELDRRQGEAKTLNNLGSIAQKLGEYEQAREYFQQSLDLTREVGDRRLEATCLGNLGLVSDELGESEGAREYHMRSLKLKRELGDQPGEVSTLNNLGSVALELEEYEQAREYFQQSLQLARELGDRNNEAKTLGNLGLVAGSLGEVDQAREYHQRCLKLAREMGDRWTEANSLGNLGLVARGQGEYEQAHEYLQQSLFIFRDIDHPQADTVESWLNELPDSKS
ncbi:TPR repeat domain containing protein [Halorhabdus tiamatea SARL4B]|uniref:TPR repeat domain containing protein n=1 Tax=Halorhabdus tiamatea SARL4B TaxID=1033806 RepID=F7PJE6_9EURY|nr:tetratricopeptide repeat protein [Halorhabdus tiamatea]ERJ05767.1 TPR repeat domain containing protein [Halorhabdus tiamatea SARL4B]CCQ34298.1 tetratricopeptide repeat-containing hypothetical protein [Halorhabdus tiamatea SARL4B]